MKVFVSEELCTGGWGASGGSSGGGICGGFRILNVLMFIVEL